MGQIVEDLLFLSRADTGEIRLIRKEMDLSEILRETVSQVALLAAPKHLRIESHLTEETVPILGDRLRIRELLLNLIENAIKYTEDGGSIHIQLARSNGVSHGGTERDKTTEKRDFAEVRVVDTGIGITKEDQERIFDRFFRADKARTREQGGSGLGLSICKWIVDAHQGKISVQSEPGKGSSFIVHLPLHTS